MTAPTSDPRGPGYDAVRRALQERGYLEPPLERLFLGGASGGRRGALGWGAVLAGLLAGPPLGLLLAAVVVAQAGGSVPLWPDGLLYALFFAPVLGLVVALLEAIATLVIRIAATRTLVSARAAAWIAGLVVGAAFALYLGFWAARQTATLGTRDLLCLAALAIGAGFAGRVVSASALIEAVLSTGVVPSEMRPRAWRVLLIGSGGFALLAALLTLAARGDVSSGVAVRDDGPPGRSLWIAWDGLSRELAEGVVRRHPELPAEAPLRAIAGGTPLATFETTDPVALWTTVATGCPPDRHGLSGTLLPTLRGGSAPSVGRGIARGPVELLTRLLPTHERIARAGVRAVPAVWELTADARRTAVIGWWATWPAALPGRTGGYLVSDAAHAAAVVGRGLDRAIEPSTWGEQQAPTWLTHARAAAGPEPANKPSGEHIAWEARVGDLFLIEALAAVASDPELRAAFLYLPGLDILRDRMRRDRLDPFERAERLEQHLLAIDRALHHQVATSPAPWRTSLLAWPGRVPAGETGSWSSDGTDLAAGEVPVTRLAAEWLHQEGLLLDRRICDRPERVPAVLTRVEPAQPEPAPEGFEQDVLERLRSLGYVD